MKSLYTADIIWSILEEFYVQIPFSPYSPFPAQSIESFWRVDREMHRTDETTPNGGF